jgi:hypothetical protein
MFVPGAAQALISGLLLVSATGKLAGCRRVWHRNCIKGSADLVLGMAVLAPLRPLSLCAAVAAIAIVSGGWWLEQRRRNASCDCFGIFAGVMDPWRHGVRAGLLLGALALLSTAMLPASGHGAAYWAGACAGCASVLASVILAFAHKPPARPAGKVLIAEPVLSLPANTISPHTELAMRSDGTRVTPADLMRPGLPLALLVTSPTCASCQALKQDIRPLLDAFPFPVRLIDEQEPGAGHAPASLFDPQARLRALLGVRTVPSLVIINDAATNILCPVAMGPQAIYGRLLDSVLTLRTNLEVGPLSSTPSGKAAPAAPAPAPDRSAAAESSI